MLIKLNEAAARLTISRRTLDRLIATGALAVVRVSPDRYAISTEEVDRYISQNTVRAQPLNLPLRSVIHICSDDAEKRLRELLKTKTRK